MKYELRSVILNVVKNLTGFQIKSGMTLLLSVFLILISITLFIHRTTAQEKNQQAYDVACEVTDAVSWKECIKRAKNKEYDLVRIMNMVDCVSKDDCAADLSGVEKAIKIYGINNTDTGFKRIDNFDYALVTIKNAKNIDIGSFLVDDTAEGDCSVLGSSCPPVMRIEGSTQITVDQLRTKFAKSSAVSVIDSGGITIKNSVFSDSYAAALLFSVTSGSNGIENNIFTHNHHGSLSEGCVGICTGAQVYILSNTKNVTIAKNTIRDGLIDIYDPLGLYASGIDIAGETVEDVSVSCNKIYNNTGNGIVVNDQSSSKNIRIEKNSLYKNGIDINVTSVQGNSIQNNCFDASCTVAGC